MPRFVLRLTLLIGLLSILLTSAGIAIGQAQPYQEWEILVFQDGVWTTSNIYLMDTNQQIIASVSKIDFSYFEGWLPTQRQIIYRLLFQEDAPDFYIFELTTGRSTPLIFPDTFEDGAYPVWSPDGQAIAMSDLYNVYLIVNGEVQNLTHRSEQEELLSSPTLKWSPDGQAIAFTTLRDIYVVDVASQQVRNVTNRLQDADVISDALSWSPDSQKIAYVTGRDFEPANLFIINLANGQTEQPTDDTAPNFQFWGPFWSDDGNLILARDRAYALLMIDLQNQTTELGSQLDFQAVNRSSDGQGLVVYDESQQHFMYFDLATRTAQPLFDYPLPDWAKLSDFEFMPKGSD